MNEVGLSQGCVARDAAGHGRLAGRRALVTGAGKGIGRAIAAMFAAQGASVACVDLDGGAAALVAQDITCSGGRALGLQGDAVSLSSVSALVERAASAFGGLDTLVNNIGIGGHGTVETTREDAWDAIMNTNPKSVYLASKFAIPHMRAAGGGAIVNIGSGVGVRAGRNWAGYGASKASVVMLTKLMALDHAADGIRVNCVCPGMIETDFARANLADAAKAKGISLEQAEREAIANYPLGRLGRPDDIAYAVLYLCSAEASWITGAVLVVDGGRCAGG